MKTNTLTLNDLAIRITVFVGLALIVADALLVR